MFGDNFMHCDGGNSLCGVVSVLEMEMRLYM